jgi:hypothetical protein
MINLRSQMPVFARHEGIWEGWYRYYDAAGNKIDEHRSRLVCRIPSEGPFSYHQTNHYEWSDGRREVRDFPATYRDGRLWFDNELIRGWAVEASEDPGRRTILLHWMRNGEPDTYLYEMIQLSDCGRYRTRVWQWLRGGQCVMRTLIDEQKVSDRWQDE